MTKDEITEQARLARESFLRRAKAEPHFYPIYLEMMYAKAEMLEATLKYEEAKRKWDEECS
jgi:hypothetical protein